MNLDEPVRDYWKRRLDTHTLDTYRGRVLSKFPEDLRTYQHVIESTRPEVIVEIGAYQGGSALWFADQLDIFSPGLSRPTVITIDHNEPPPFGDDRIRYLKAEVELNRGLSGLVAELVAGRRCMVSEDGGHTYVTTRAALDWYSHLVSPGCYFVVEDGVVDEPDLRLPHYETGVQPAIVDFLATEAGKRFTRHHLAPYGLTTCHGGWLEAA